MGTALPKQFLPLLGKPVLHYAIKAFRDTFPGIRIILVLPADQLSYANIVLQSFEDGIDLDVVTGGPTRFHSVQQGLQQVEPGSIIFVHDGVRPLIDTELLQRCYDTAIEYGSAIPAIAVSDSIRQCSEGHSIPVNRDQLRIIQTPQTFRSDILLDAFSQEYQDSFTDEATVVQAYGEDVVLVEGSKKNIKVTTPEDLLIAAALMNATQQ
ncbi:2-C-methyl-D-erythritol 4-phosphate cytidylyltransferase [Taibaiella chishuiensis]|uniref:2-C-methyl-D-erythritol 4-phosphate cytidylyltransferase n=2 Tax=Taibaiella chishuiensis TaxID=1434707 RepID=A0A2P8CST5_9BACT|nr:2-C-methyl-D-erythritol 4-phosphate cytidylyltransferase [Taibaiella chishuiensis]